MRIALVHYTCLPVIAGVELVMAEHARLFAEAGHTVTVVAGSAAGESGVREVEDLGAHSPLAQRAQAELATGGIGIVFEQAVAELVARLRPIFAAQDLVILHNVATMHFHLALTAALWRLADELPAVRFACWVHDLAACNPDYAPLPPDRAPWNLLAQAHPRWSYVAVSDLRRRQFTALTGAPPGRCRTIPNGVDAGRLLDLPPETATLASRFELLQRDVVLLHPTRLLRRKNVELSLRVAAAIKAAGRSCACLITAPPDAQHSPSAQYEAEIRQLHLQLGLRDDVLFLNDSGPVGPREMSGLFRVSDALFLPSRQEGFGIPLLEAALHRLPIFCSDIEPLNTLLTAGVTTFPADGAPDTIAALILHALDRDAAVAARKQAQRSYSWDAIYRNFLSPLLAELDTP